MPELDQLRQCARPIVFATGLVEAPFAIAGTSFLAGFRRKLFVITARHVVREWPVNRLLIFPSDRSVRPLRLSEFWRVEDPENEPDGSDILLIRADLKGIPNAIRRSGHLLHLTPPEISDWFEDRHSSLFFMFGYPSAANEADYATSQIKTQQFFLRGNYRRESGIAYGCHEIQLENPLSLPDFNGLSGSPVFSLRHEIGVARQPTFCGMALRGNAGSNRVHFLEASTILLALQSAFDAQQSVAADAPQASPR